MVVVGRGKQHVDRAALLPKGVNSCGGGGVCDGMREEGGGGGGKVGRGKGG